MTTIYEATERIATLEKQKAELLEALQRISKEAGEDYGGNFTWRVSEDAMFAVRAAIKNAGGQ